MSLKKSSISLHMTPNLLFAARRYVERNGLGTLSGFVRQLLADKIGEQDVRPKVGWLVLEISDGHHIPAYFTGRVMLDESGKIVRKYKDWLLFSTLANVSGKTEPPTPLKRGRPKKALEAKNG